MRVLCINPNKTGAITQLIADRARLAAGPRTEVVAVNPTDGPAAIQTADDEKLATEQTLKSLSRWGIDNFDAAVVACFGDPGLDELRGATGIPVVGIAESAMLTACALGRTFSIVTALDSAVPLMESLVDKYGLGARLASVRPSGVSVLELAAGQDTSRAAVEAVAERTIGADGARAVCLGCASMGPLAESLTVSLAVPVLDGVTCAIKILESSFEGV